MAHQKALARRAHSRRRSLGVNSCLKNLIIKRLQAGHSPEQIAHRLRLEYPCVPTMHISHESIYLMIYNDAKNGENLYHYLRRTAKWRKRRFHKNSRRLQIPNRKSIHMRPMVVARRKRIGDWEGDHIT